ncbi:MAG: glycosyltransferase family 2 protein [Saprospiraceae bacterium]|nr:glycosyltransferase family 2 protein [Saprospiraceae bacterium]
MRISGFTMAKNTSKLYYPIKEAIESILPICDEFVVALGDCDPDDQTEALIKSIGSDKIRIIHTVWDLEKYPRGMENAHQTDIAREACSGDWLFYLQADEVVHEKYLDTIVQACQTHLEDEEVEGFLFRYKHFFGNYAHYNDHHGWYPYEIRVVRNHPDIHSYISAQSFRRIPDFDGLNYRQKENTFKLTVKKIDAEIYHYGWVRPPKLMQAKSKSLDGIHKGRAAMEEAYKEKAPVFDYGNMNWYKRFKGTHPRVMAPFIAQYDWEDELHFEKDYQINRPPMKHEKIKYRVLTWIEQHLFGGRQLFGYSNWRIK